ncbi:hypothetical protein CHR62_01705 [Pusillimonas sp. NJUB218]|nr:hypothetical protein CHR62_01705 [Pusillimonas sp. NJUB218]
MAGRKHSVLRLFHPSIASFGPIGGLVLPFVLRVGFGVKNPTAIITIQPRLAAGLFCMRQRVAKATGCLQHRRYDKVKPVYQPLPCRLGVAPGRTWQEGPGV